MRRHARPAALQNVFEVVRDARDRAVQRVQAAIPRGEVLHGFEVDDAARTYIKERGFGEYFVHRTGHSIGEEVHGTGANMDNLETHDERRIIARTCFSIEPGVYLPEFGIRSEVNVYVGAKEAQVTGEVQQKLVTYSVTVICTHMSAASLRSVPSSQAPLYQHLSRPSPSCQSTR